MTVTTKQLLSITLPGFVVTLEDSMGLYAPYNATAVRFMNEAEKIRIEVEAPKPCRQKHPDVRHKAIKHVQGRTVGPHEWCMVASGHTWWWSYRKGFWASFDRLGVEDSFYVHQYDTLEQVRATLVAQVERVEKQRALSARSVDIPGLPYSVTPEGKAEIIKKLAGKAGSHTWHPSGFGTARVISTRPDRDSKRLPAETAAFFGVKELWVYEFEMD